MGESKRGRQSQSMVPSPSIEKMPISANVSGRDPRITNVSPSADQENGTDASGRPYVEVTVDYPYRTITAFPGVPREVSLTRSVRMYRAAITPNAN